MMRLVAQDMPSALHSTHEAFSFTQIALASVWKPEAKGFSVMKVSKITGLIILLIFVLNIFAQASGLGAVTPQSSKCRCPVKKKRAPAIQADTNPPPVSLPQPRKRCPSNNRQQVSFKLRSSPVELQAYPFIEDDGERTYYCVGTEERFQHNRDLLDVRIGSRFPSERTISSSPSVCVPATAALRAMPTVKPVPADVPEQTRPVEKVLLTVTFYEDGTVGPVEVEQSPSPKYSAIARAAARKIRFNPAWENGRPVCVTQTVDYVFRLQPGTGTRDVPLEPEVALLEPDSGKVLKNQPRIVRFVWRPIPGAHHYVLEVDYSSLTSSAWVRFRRVPELTTSHELEFPGPYAGRWRVTAMRPDGTMLADSNWSYFGYEK